MLNTKKIESKRIVGVEVITLKQAIEKAKQEEFVMMHQSQVTEEAYGILKPFSSQQKEGYYFIPILINEEMVTK